MIETASLRTGRRWARLARGRMHRNRWHLAVGVVCVLAVALFGSGSPIVAIASIAVLVAGACLLPGKQPRPVVVPVAMPERPASEDLTAVGLAAAVADPLIVFDHRGMVTMANEAARAAFGDIVPGISLPLKFRAPELQDMIEGVVAGRYQSLSLDYVERVPIERAYRVTATPVGRGTGLHVMVFRDQSEARRIDRMRADFIANASHELRTPLASISGFVETLRGPARNDPKARDQFLQIMQGQTARMARLIDDLLSLSRLEMKALSPGNVKVDIRPVIDGVVDALKPLAADTGVEIESRPGSERLEVFGDRDELVQVFQNLIENACKYGQTGGRVIVSAAAEGAEVAVSVRDFGPGIAEEHIPRITERFYRVDVETSRAQKGTGLGLAIVKHIVTRHRGRLTIRSTVGEGSTFTVHLPRAA